MIGKLIGFIIVLFLISVFNVNDFVNIYNFGRIDVNAGTNGFRAATFISDETQENVIIFRGTFTAHK